MRNVYRLRVGSFLRSVLLIAGSTALAQVVRVALSPILTRLYSPEAWGLLGLFVSFLGVASVFVNLRYEVAIVAANDDTEASALTRSSLVLAMFSGVAAAFFFELLRRKGLAGYGAFPKGACILVPLALIPTGWGVTLRYYVMRKGHFGLVGRYTVIQAFARVLAQVGLAFLGSVGLLVAEVVGRVAGLQVLSRILTPSTERWFAPGTLRKYRTYPLVQLPSSVLDTLALMAPVPVFVSKYGIAVGGALALAERVVSSPMSLIGGAVADVFYNRAAHLARTNPRRLRPFLLATVARLGMLSVPLALALAHVAPRVVSWIFGPDWKQAGEMIGALAPWMAATLTVSPVTRVVFLSRYGWLKLVYDCGSLVIVSLPLILPLSNPISALELVSWAKAVQFLVYLLLLVLMVGTLQNGKECIDAAGVTARQLDRS